MVLLDDDRRHVEVNGAYVQLLGYRPSELIGRPVSELRADGATVSAERWHAALRQKQFTGTIELLRADGGRRHRGVRGSPRDRHRPAAHAVRGSESRPRSAAARRRRCRRRHAPDLSPRELDVVKLLALGFSGPEVAEELRIAHNTVRTHTRNAMTKVGARSRAQLVAMSLAECMYWPAERSF